MDYKLSYIAVLWPHLTVDIEGIGEYAGHLYKPGTAVVDASYFKIDSIPDQAYTGSEIKPVPKAMFGTIPLISWDGTYGDYNVPTRTTWPRESPPRP